MVINAENADGFADLVQTIVTILGEFSQPEWDVVQVRSCCMPIDN